MLALVENIREQQLVWIADVTTRNGWTPTEWARLAGVDPSTLSKFLTDPSNIKILSTRSERKLELAAGRTREGETLLASLNGMAEAEAVAYRIGERDDTLTRAIKAATEGQNAVVPWVLKTTALNAAGYMPDDILLVDLNLQARDGDVVCVQIYRRDGTADTVFRIMETPFLVAAHFGQHLFKPVLMGSDNVVLRGAVVSSFRPRPHRTGL